MYDKINTWLREKKNIEFESDVDGSGWVFVLTYQNALLNIYLDELDKVRVESVARIPSYAVDKQLIKGVYSIAYENGLCIRSIDNAPLSVYMYKYGVAIPEKLLTKKWLFSSIHSLFIYAEALEEFIMSYMNSVDDTCLDLSMFTSDDVNINDLNLDVLVQMREMKFGGSWAAFKSAISIDQSEKAQKLTKYIDKCVEFEDKNKKDLAEVHQQVKEELAIIFEELSNNDIIYN